MLRHSLLALLLVCVAYIATTNADPREVESAEFKDDFGDEYDDRLTRTGELDQRFVFALEHNVPSPTGAPFSPRGKVEIVLSASGAKPKVTFVDTPALGTAEIASLETLLRAGKHYSVRARSDPANDASAFVVTSIPMCMLAGTRLREDLTLHLSDNGKLIAMEYLTPYVSDANCLEFQKRELTNAKLSPQAAVLTAQNGPSPPKQLVPKKKAAPKGVKKPVQSEEGEPAAEENQSFLRRYWYVVVPLVVMSLFGGDSGPPAGAAAGGAAPAAGGGGPRRR